jgi:hypothetical protein
MQKFDSQKNHSTPQSIHTQNQPSITSKKALVIFGETIDKEFIKRELSYFKKYIKEKKSAKILLGLLSFFLLLSLVYFIFLSGLPIWLGIIFFLLILIIGIGSFFLELVLLKKRQFLTGVFIIDLFYGLMKKSLKKKFKMKPPFLLTYFRSILRITFPFFRRVSKSQYEKMTPVEKQKYMQNYHKYLSKLYK